MVKRNRREWEKLIAAQARSNLTHREFCEEHGLSLGTFKYWRYELSRQSRKKTSKVTTQSLVRIVTAESTASASIETVLPGGVLLRFIPGTDPQYLARLISELEASQC